MDGAGGRRGRRGRDRYCRGVTILSYDHVAGVYLPLYGHKEGTVIRKGDDVTTDWRMMIGVER